MRYPFDQSTRAEELFMNPDNNDGVYQSDAIHYNYFELRTMFQYLLENKIATFQEWLKHISFGKNTEDYIIDEYGKNTSCYIDDVEELVARPTEILDHSVKHSFIPEYRFYFWHKIKYFFEDFFKKAFYIVNIDTLSNTVVPAKSLSKDIINYDDKYTFIEDLINGKISLSLKQDFLPYKNILFNISELLIKKGYLYASAYRTKGVTSFEKDLLFSKMFIEN